MAEYINKEKLIKRLEVSPLFLNIKTSGSFVCDGVIDIINKQSVADVVKVVHGEWIAHGYKWRCSVCNHRLNLDGTPTENGFYFCPNCGAKMDARSKNTLPEATRQTVLNSFMKGSEN